MIDIILEIVYIDEIPILLRLKLIFQCSDNLTLGVVLCLQYQEPLLEIVNGLITGGCVSSKLLDLPVTTVDLVHSLLAELITLPLEIDVALLQLAHILVSLRSFVIVSRYLELL